MTSDNNTETVQSRRGVLSVVATSILFGGCLATAEGSDSPATRVEMDSSTFETRTPAQVDTPTPTATEATNETKYPVDHPNERTNKPYGPLINHDYGGVRPVRSQAEWRQLVTEGPTHDSTDEFLGYEFVTQTDFDTEAVVVVEQRVLGGESVRLQSVEGVGTPHLWLNVRRTGTGIYNMIVERYVFVRIPVRDKCLKRITAEVRHGADQAGWADTQIEYYVYWDSDSQPQTDVRTQRDLYSAQQNRTGHTAPANLRRGDQQ